MSRILQRARPIASLSERVSKRSMQEPMFMNETNDNKTCFMHFQMQSKTHELLNLGIMKVELVVGIPRGVFGREDGESVGRLRLS